MAAATKSLPLGAGALSAMTALLPFLRVPAGPLQGWNRDPIGKKPPPKWRGLFMYAGGRTRTCNLRFRRPTLYPIELHPQVSFLLTTRSSRRFPPLGTSQRFGLPLASERWAVEGRASCPSRGEASSPGSVRSIAQTPVGSGGALADDAPAPAHANISNPITRIGMNSSDKKNMTQPGMSAATVQRGAWPDDHDTPTGRPHSGQPRSSSASPRSS